MGFGVQELSGLGLSTPTQVGVVLSVTCGCVAGS